MNKLITTSFMAAALGLVFAVSPTVALAHNDSPSKNGTAVQVVIAEPGTVLVRGAKVTSVSGSTITAQTTWGATTMTWSVVTDSATKYYTRLDNTASLGQVAVGDTVSFAGAFTGSGMTVRATAVKDWTLESNAASVSGKVATINTGTNSLTLTQKNSTTITVQLAAGTVVTLKSGGTVALSSVAVGDTVKAVGTFNTDKTVVTATTLTVTPQTAVHDKKYEGLVKSWFNGKSFFNFNFR